MSRSVRQLSEQLHISKQAVYQRINAINGFRKNYTKRLGNHLEISDAGVNILISYVKDSQQDFKEPIDEMYSMLIEQLKMKDKQIATKDEQILNLQQSLKDEQKLSINSITEIKQLRNRMKRLNVNPDDDDIQVSEFKETNNHSDSVNSASDSFSSNNEPSKANQPFWKFWKH